MALANRFKLLSFNLSDHLEHILGCDKVYIISWGFNHQLKLLVELVSCHGIRSQHDGMSWFRIIHPSFQVKLFSTNYNDNLCCIRTHGPKSYHVKGRNIAYRHIFGLFGCSHSYMEHGT